MVIRGGGYVLGNPRTGFQEGGKKGGVNPRRNARLTEGVLNGGGVQCAEGVRKGEVQFEGGKGGRGVGATTGGISRASVGVEIADQDWGNGGVGGQGAKGGKKGLPLRAKIGARRCMKVDEGEGSTPQNVCKTRAVVHRRRRRNPGQGGDGTAIKGRGEHGVASRRGKTV